MATGDNLLTAYAVGKKCGIIDPDLPAYLGDLKEVNGKTRLHWTKITSQTELGLQIMDQPTAPLDNVSKIERMIPWEFDEEDETSEFSLGITGKAFDFLLKSPKMEYVL